MKTKLMIGLGWPLVILLTVFPYVSNRVNELMKMNSGLRYENNGLWASLSESCSDNIMLIQDIKTQTDARDEVVSNYLALCGSMARVVAERDMWKSYGDRMRDWSFIALKNVDRDYWSIYYALPAVPKHPAAPEMVEVPKSVADKIPRVTNVVIRAYVMP